MVAYTMKIVAIHTLRREVADASLMFLLRTGMRGAISLSILLLDQMAAATQTTNIYEVEASKVVLVAAGDTTTGARAAQIVTVRKVIEELIINQ